MTMIGRDIASDLICNQSPDQEMRYSLQPEDKCMMFALMHTKRVLTISDSKMIPVLCNVLLLPGNMKIVSALCSSVMEFCKSQEQGKILSDIWCAWICSLYSRYLFVGRVTMARDNHFTQINSGY